MTDPIIDGDALTREEWEAAQIAAGLPFSISDEASETPAKHIPPAPVRWLNFPGDAREAIGQTVGPTTLRERLTAVTADYNPDTNVTRVGYVYGRLLPEQIANARTAAGLAPIPA